jgi:hypothetical protein
MEADATRESMVKRFGATFVGLFLCLNLVPLMLVSIPLLEDPLGALWIVLWSVIAPLVGSLVGIDGPIDTMPNGSSDMTWNYLQQLCYLVVAAVAAVVWVARVRRRSADETLQAWVRIVLRYGLALHMFSYGFIKVIPMQFHELGPVHLART